MTAFYSLTAMGAPVQSTVVYIYDPEDGGSMYLRNIYSRAQLTSTLIERAKAVYI
jgi:hypothetical protein